MFNHRSSLKSAVGGFFESFSNMRTAVTENDQLRERVMQLEGEVRQSETLTTENERLKTLLNFQNESKYKILPARVIGRDPSTWFDSSTINRGSLDGVKLNMPVVTNGGLVGTRDRGQPADGAIHSFAG